MKLRSENRPKTSKNNQNRQKTPKNTQSRPKSLTNSWLEARELHKPVTKKFKTRQIITYGIDHIWAADLLIMTKYSRQNQGYKYILNVIDCFSKMVWAVPMKTKTAKVTAEAFEKILKTSHRKPQLLHTDRGSEFIGIEFERLLSKYNIGLYHTFSEVKSSIIERFNRTLNAKLKLHFEVNQNNKWVSILRSILKEYNEKDVHRTIGCPPAQVTKKNEKDILERMYPLHKFKLEKSAFKVGERVRITRKVEVFDNKYLRKWTTEIFLISKVHYTNPITYAITALDGEEIRGHFYKQELQRTKF
jgi:transposase InsO family protein